MTDFVETRCAVCQLTDGLVVNIIIAVSSDPAQTDCQHVEIMNEQRCDIGWLWNGETFIQPEVIPNGH